MSPIYRTCYISGLWAKFLAVEMLSFPASPVMARDYQPVLAFYVKDRDLDSTHPSLQI